MDYINVTELRTKTPRLRENLDNGKDTYLVYRSQIIGVIAPVRTKTKIKKFNYEKFVAALNELPKMKLPSYEERDQLKRAYLEGKYGKRVS